MIQITTGALEVTEQDKIHTIGGIQFVVKVRKYEDGSHRILVLANRGSGWDHVQVPSPLNSSIPSDGDAHAILLSALPVINKMIADATAPIVEPPTLPTQIDALIQTLQVVDNQLAF